VRAMNLPAMPVTAKSRGDCVQTIRCHGVEVARELALLFGIGTKALPAWNSKMRRNNLKSGLAIRL
jgi:hypothetical protein